jgi:hypothetical protein
MGMGTRQSQQKQEEIWIATEMWRGRRGILFISG